MAPGCLSDSSKDILPERGHNRPTGLGEWPREPSGSSACPWEGTLQKVWCKQMRATQAHCRVDAGRLRVLLGERQVCASTRRGGKGPLLHEQPNQHDAVRTAPNEEEQVAGDMILLWPKQQGSGLIFWMHMKNKKGLGVCYGILILSAIIPYTNGIWRG